MKRVALYLQDKHPIREEMKLSQYAEKRGFEAIWHAESRLARDALTPLAAIAAVTERIKLGTGVINNWTRNVGLTATSFLTLDELSGGRSLLGIGAWWDPLAWKVGIERKKPLKAMREYVTVLKQLFKMENVTFEGEFVKVRDLMRQEGLKQDDDFKLWIMAEVPSNIILADEFCKAGVDGFSIGSNDLTMLILGADRDNEVLAPLFDERNLAVKRAIKSLIETAHEYGKTVSICGQAPSVYQDFAKFLVESGIDSMSVNPDVVVQTRRLIAQVEQRILLERLTSKK